MGYALAFVAHEFDDAVAFMDRGLTVNPNLASAWSISAWLRVWRGEPDLALDHAAHAMRLSPLDPSMYGMRGAMAYAHFLASRYDMASSCAEKAMRERPIFLLAIEQHGDGLGTNRLLLGFNSAKARNDDMMTTRNAFLRGPCQGRVALAYSRNEINIGR